MTRRVTCLMGASILAGAFLLAGSLQSSLAQELVPVEDTVRIEPQTGGTIAVRFKKEIPPTRAFNVQLEETTAPPRLRFENPGGGFFLPGVWPLYPSGTAARTQTYDFVDTGNTAATVQVLVSVQPIGAIVPEDGYGGVGFPVTVVIGGADDGDVSGGGGGAAATAVLPASAPHEIIASMGEYYKGVGRFFEGYGDFHVDVATARNLHAEAYDKELDNWEKQVHVYFRRRLANQEYRRMLDPPRDERLKIREQRMRDKVRVLYQEVARNGGTSELNWLRVELFKQRMDTGQLYDSLGAYPSLEPYHIENIRLTDRPAHGQIWSLSDGAVLKQETWPELLDSDEFAPPRQTFESRRNAALDELKQQGKLSGETKRGLSEAVEQLAEQFRVRYQPALRPGGEPSVQKYANAKAFITSLRSQVYRFVATSGNVPAGGDFHGTTVAELVDYMGTRGLRFADPEPGGDGAYEYLYFAMLSMYERNLALYGGPDADEGSGDTTEDSSFGRRP